MKKKLLDIIILIGYCIPFAFLSVNGDAASRTMIYFLLMIIGFGLLCFLSLKNKKIVLIYVGNELSCISSYTIGKIIELEPMGYYFKPFTAYSLIIFISIIATVLQTILVLLYTKKYKNN